MRKLKLLFTFDYELPLGRSSSYTDGLFSPADKLIEVATNLEVPVVFFADICSAIRFKEWDCENYYLPFKNQLHKALRLGHDVQLHIHPHWMNSTYEAGTFVPSPNFSLSSFGQNAEISIEYIIETAHDALVDLCREVIPEYKCVAFRAGGYNIEPETKRILNRLYQMGIRIDSSVIKGLYQDYGYSHVDYREMPDLPHWTISRDGPLNKVATSDFYELPITGAPCWPFDIIERRFKKTRHAHEYRNRKYNNSGYGFAQLGKKQSGLSRVRSLFNPLVLTPDREYVDVDYLARIVDYNIKKASPKLDELILTLIGHPKSMGAYHLNLFTEFVDFLRSEYPDKIEFTTYAKVHEELAAGKT